jgi:2-aminoadipate transaminase
MHEFLSNYNWEEHLQRITNQYKKQKEVMMDCLERYFSANVQYTRPDGGMFTWLSLPKNINSRQLLERALEKDIIFVPGDTFYVSQPDTQTLRLNYSNVEEEEMRKAMLSLAEIINC